jgi:DNA-binding NarL/FixJ family response regulator
MNVLILTSYSDEELLFDAICAGAYGYVLKQVASDDLLRALEAVGRGEGWIDPKLAHSLFKRVGKAMLQLYAKVFAPLSRQELRIFALLSKGKNNKYIACTLALSDGTVRNYVTSLMGKLKLNSRVQACVFALKHHIHEHLPMRQVF